MNSALPKTNGDAIAFVSEADVAAVVDQSEVNAAIEACFANLASGEARNFPVVREKLSYQNAIFGFKSGFDRTGPALGIKAGGLWPGNRSQGLPNHQSTIVLFDPETGGPSALVCGTYLTALRTAAASALSVRYLARGEASTLGVTAAGGQAEFQLRACLAKRNFTRVLLPQRESRSGEGLRAKLADLDVRIDVVPMEALCRESDVLVTIALSFDAYVASDWIREGTHIACMGTDTVGKQEVATALFASAAVFGDAPDQNIALGECQHAAAAGLLSAADITPLGDVINGTHPGRRDRNDITVFDSTGMGLQDLAAAHLVLARALESGHYTQLDRGTV